MLRKVSVIIENSTLTGLVNKRALWVCVTEEAQGWKRLKFGLGFAGTSSAPGYIEFANIALLLAPSVFVTASRPQFLDAASPLVWLSTLAENTGHCMLWHCQDNSHGM